MSDEEQDEKWCHFLMLDQKVQVDVPVSFIEGYCPEMNLQLKKKYFVFWSPDENDTPRSILESKDRGPIIRVNPKLVQKPIMGWYESILLAVADSFQLLETELGKKRVSRPPAKLISQDSFPSPTAAGSEKSKSDTKVRGGSKTQQSQQKRSSKKDQTSSEQKKPSKGKSVAQQQKSASSAAKILNVLSLLGTNELLTDTTDEQNKGGSSAGGIDDGNKADISEKIKEPVSDDSIYGDDKRDTLEKIPNVNEGMPDSKDASKNTNFEGSLSNVVSRPKTNVDSESDEEPASSTSDAEYSSGCTRSPNSDVPVQVHQDLQEKFKAKQIKCQNYERKFSTMRKEITQLKEENEALELQLKNQAKKYDALLKKEIAVKEEKEALDYQLKRKTANFDTVVALNIDLQVKISSLDKTKTKSYERQTEKKSTSSGSHASRHSTSSGSHASRHSTSSGSHASRHRSSSVKSEGSRHRSTSLTTSTEQLLEKTFNADECVDTEYSLLSLGTPPSPIVTEVAMSAKNKPDLGGDYSKDLDSSSAEVPAFQDNTEIFQPPKVPSAVEAPQDPSRNKRKRKAIDDDDDFSLMSEAELRKKLSEPSFNGPIVDHISV